MEDLAVSVISVALAALILYLVLRFVVYPTRLPHEKSKSFWDWWNLR